VRLPAALGSAHAVNAAGMIGVLAGLLVAAAALHGRWRRT